VDYVLIGIYAVIRLLIASNWIARGRHGTSGPLATFVFILFLWPIFLIMWHTMGRDT